MGMTWNDGGELGIVEHHGAPRGDGTALSVASIDEATPVVVAMFRDRDCFSHSSSVLAL